MTIGLDVLTLIVLMLVLLIVGGHLHRIAEAIEAQNRHYGSEQPSVVEGREKAA